ncbi:MAG: hypothetical protein R6X07_10295 [Desulfatiglandales bacterium]
MLGIAQPVEAIGTGRHDVQAHFFGKSEIAGRQGYRKGFAQAVGGRGAAAGPVINFDQINAQSLEHGNDGHGIIIGHALK